ncbi:MAG: DinB family protein [Anaerolineae bacterium]|nr:DinB family protein [Anaerolineae bacterium]
MKNWIQSMATGLMLERPAQKLTLAGHAAQLEGSAHALIARFAAAPDTEENREQLRHIIGIERWGQRHLLVALGEPDTEDEYDGYRPSNDLDWDELRGEFRTTRHDTISIALELAEADVGIDVTVMHKQYGKLSVYAWLYYLNTHANLEGERVK